MKIFKTTPEWDFLGKRKIAFVISAVLILASVIGLFTKGLTYGIDFKSGMLIQVKFQEAPDLGEIRSAFQERIETSVSITTFGEVEDNEVIITLSEEAVESQNRELNEIVRQILSNEYKNFEIRRVETVGSKVGSTLRGKATKAAGYVLIGILIYIGFRFKVRYGVAAVVALFHDVLITLGVFVFTEKEFTLTVMAALMTIIGYSLNDTIVVFDRVRENTARFPRKPTIDVLNLSINESLSRTILTSVTTFLVVFTLWVLGGDIIHDFCFALLIGLVVGTYSSVFVASPVVLNLTPEVLEKNKTYRSAKEAWTNIIGSLTGKKKKRVR